MAERIPPENERGVAERLRAEADLSRPVFSDRLHERICRAALQSESRAAPLPTAMRLGRRRVQAIAVTAAVVILSVVAWWATHRQGPVLDPNVPEIVKEKSPPETDAADPLDELNTLAVASGRKAGDLGLLVDSTLSAQRWGYLDQDARTATRLLIDQLPQIGPP